MATVHDYMGEHLMKCTCGTKAPLAPFSNDKVAKASPIIIGGWRCPFCSQLYTSDGRKVDMTTVVMCCGLPKAVGR